LSLFLVGNKEDEEKIYPRISRRGLLDGILVQAGQPDDKLISQLFKSNLPTVMIGRPFDPAGINYIDVDNINAASKATMHLINLGYTRIATITGNKGSAVTDDRVEGYKRALQNNGIAIDEKLIVEGDFTEPSGYAAMKQLLDVKPDAVFAGSDVMAAGAIRAAQEVGIRVPEDMGVIGFDDVPLSSITAVQLTTIRQPILRLGIKAVELLIDIIENGITPARRIILDTELVIRDSCGEKRLVQVPGSE